MKNRWRNHASRLFVLNMVRFTGVPIVCYRPRGWRAPCKVLKHGFINRMEEVIEKEEVRDGGCDAIDGDTYHTCTTLAIIVVWYFACFFPPPPPPCGTFCFPLVCLNKNKSCLATINQQSSWRPKLVQAAAEACDLQPHALRIVCPSYRWCSFFVSFYKFLQVLRRSLTTSNLVQDRMCDKIQHVHRS